MSLLDLENIINDNSVIVQCKEEEIYSKSLFLQGTVNCVVADDEINVLATKISQAYHINKEMLTSFDCKIRSILDNAISPELKTHSTREIISLDCRKLRKGDAYGWMSKLAKQCKDQIIIVNYVTRIPNVDSDVYDDYNYVTNLLLRSWKNENIYFGDFHIDRRSLTIILTCPPEDKEILLKECGLNSYSWFGDFEEWEKETKELALVI